MMFGPCTYQRVTKAVALTSCLRSYCDARGCHQRLMDRCKYMANLLGVDEVCSRRLVYKNDTLQRLDKSRIEKTFDTLREIGISVPHIVKHPEILSYYPGFIDGRYWTLTEFGLRPIKIPEILRYNSLMKKRSYELRRLKLLPDNVEPFGHLLSKFTDLDTRFVANHPDVENRTLFYMKKLILLEFLSQKLNCTRTEVVTLIKKYPVIANRSICSVRRSLQVLLDRFGFTPDKVKSNGFLLTAKTCNVNRIADVLSETIGSQHLKEFVSAYPKTIAVSVSKLVANNECLASYGITPEQILKRGTVYTLNTDTLRERLCELNSTDAFRALKSSPRVLTLICSMKKAKERLLNYESVGYTDPSLCHLGSTQLEFDRRFTARVGHSSARAGILELALYLGRSEREISQSLAVHPLRRGVSLKNISRVLCFLDKRGFTKEQILNGIQLVLYSPDVVETYIEALPNTDECRSFGHDDWERHPFALQLLLYVIKKNSDGHHHHQVQNAEKPSVQCAVTELMEEDCEEREEKKARKRNGDHFPRGSSKLPELRYGSYGRLVVTDTSDDPAVDEVESFLESKKDEEDSQVPSILTDFGPQN